MTLRARLSNFYAGLGLVAGGLAIAGAAQPPFALINESASVPTGLYRRSLDGQPRAGRLVAIAPPPAARAYLAGLGAPPDTRLLKRVAAVGGQHVCRRGAVLRAPDRDVAVMTRDRRGAPLPVWRGCRALGPDELLVLGDTPTSFDGRYFGPVRRSAVLGVYEEVMRW